MFSRVSNVVCAACLVCATVCVSVSENVTSSGIRWRTTTHAVDTPVLMLIPPVVGISLPEDYNEDLTGVTFVTFDHCGIGDSRACDGQSWDRYVDDAVDVARAARAQHPEARRFVLAAYSSSCFVAQRVMQRVTFVDALVFVSPLVDVQSARAVTHDCMRRRFGALPARVLEHYAEPLYYLSFQKWCGVYCAQTTFFATGAVTCRIPSLTDVTARELLHANRIRTQLWDEYRVQSLRGLNVSVPLLVMSGAYDRVAPYALVSEAVDAGELAAPDLRVRVFPDASHHIRYEEPEAFAEVVTAFVASL